MLSATAIFAQFDTGKAQVCGGEIVVADQALSKDEKAALPGWGYWPAWLILTLWVLLSTILVLQVVTQKVRDAVGAMRPDTETTTSSSHARGTPQEKGTQVEVHDLEGLTVEGLKGLCERFGLRRSGLRGELIVRIMAELRDREARCA